MWGWTAAATCMSWTSSEQYRGAGLAVARRARQAAGCAPTQRETPWPSSALAAHATCPPASCARFVKRFTPKGILLASWEVPKPPKPANGDYVIPYINMVSEHSMTTALRGIERAQHRRRAADGVPRSCAASCRAATGPAACGPGARSPSCPLGVAQRAQRAPHRPPCVLPGHGGQPSRERVGGHSPRVRRRRHLWRPFQVQQQRPEAGRGKAQRHPADKRRRAILRWGCGWCSQLGLRVSEDSWAGLGWAGLGRELQKLAPGGYIRQTPCVVSASLVGAACTLAGAHALRTVEQDVCCAPLTHTRSPPAGTGRLAVDGQDTAYVIDMDGSGVLM